MATGYAETLKTTSPEAYAKIAKLAQYTANENFGGQIQDYQAQIFTPLSGDVLAQANNPEGRIPTEDGYAKDLGKVNGIPITAVYDSSGKLTGYQGDSRTRSFLDGSHSVSGNWDASGQPNPQQYSSSGGGFFNNLISDLGSGLSSAVKDIAGSIKEVASSPAGQIGLAFLLPGAGAALAAELGLETALAGSALANSIGVKAAATAVGTALASTALQTANGVPFEDALRNATVNAIVSTGSPAAANSIAKSFEGNEKLADALTSGGASIVSTLAKGGNPEDAIKNAVSAVVASGATQLAKNVELDDGSKLSQQTSRDIGATVGGALTGGATGALTGLASELGRPTTTGGGVKLASAGDVISDPNVVTDSPTQDFGIETIVGNKPGLASTDVQVLDQIRRENAAAPNAVPAAAATPTAPATQPAATTRPNELPAVDVTTKRTPTDIANTDVQVVNQTSQQPTRQYAETITADRLPPVTIADTDIQTSSEIPKVITVTDSKIQPTIADTDVQVEDTETPIDKPVEEADPYKPDLFIYSGQQPKKSTLSRSLGTDLQSSSYPSTAPQGLTAARGAGEIEGEGGINRKNVWNEQSLRLKDALGL
jgi:hypothetical protein